jgi:zinc transporter 1/2/3
MTTGMELFEKTGSIVMTASLMAIFSSMSPIGIFIVILTESKISDNDSPLIILLSAVATGTILYIVFFEILQRNKGHSNNKSPPPQSFGLILYISMIFGFSCMLYMTLYVVH